MDDLSVGSNVFGMFVAALAVVSSGMQQIYVGTMQAKHKLNANELLSNTAPAQVRTLQPSFVAASDSSSGLCARRQEPPSGWIVVKGAPVRKLGD